MPRFNRRPRSHTPNLVPKPPIPEKRDKTEPLAKRPGEKIDETHQKETSRSNASFSGELRAGKLFASFELQRQLEISSTGSVWLAQDYGVIRHKEEVALKFLPAFAVNAGAASEVLKKEIRRTTALKHPSILRIYDLIESKGKVALQMEYLDGPSLSHLRLAKPEQVFEIRDLEAWVRQLCEALEYAHREIGLSHGDISPDTLIVDSHGNLRLKNFGITNCLRQAADRLRVKHRLPAAVPSQNPESTAQDESGMTDDLSALGATIYELLTGKPPYVPGDINKQRVPPSMTERRAELGIRGKIIPKNWEETVAACLAKDPLRRPQTAAEIQSRLKSSPGDVAASSTVRSLLTRKPWPAIVCLIIVLAIISATVAYSWRQVTKTEEASNAVRAIPPNNRTPLLRENEEVSPVVAETVATDPELKKEQKNDQPEAAAGVVNEDGPAKVVSAAGPADPASGSGSDEKASSLPAASPPSDASSKGFTENDPAPSHAVSSSTPPEVQRGASSEVSSPSTSAVPLAEIASPKAAKADPASATEDQIPNEAIKEEVIRRINALPKVAPEKKANLIEKMHKARSMERLCVVPFEKGQTALRKVAAGELVKTFAGPSMLAKLSDPTMILVVAGYADLGGRAEQNFRFSQERAENVSKILKEQANLFNAMQVIGMGGTEILDSKRPDQNRAVEVWSVVPL